MRRRGTALLGAALAGGWAVVALDLDLGDLAPGPGGWSVVADFVGAAVHPALVDQGGQGVALLPRALELAWATVVVAAAGLSLALPVGFVLGLASSTRLGGEVTRLGAGRVAAARALAAGMRSVHELLWAILFLAALGRSNSAALIAIAVPSAGVLAKVFGELLDEAPLAAGDALRGMGATGLQAFLAGVLPRALPDMCAYALYRFECALRSAAVLGFFGFPTLGYAIASSAENLYWAEVWTWLWTLFALVMGVDLWSRAVRRRLVGS